MWGENDFRFTAGTDFEKYILENLLSCKLLANTKEGIESMCEVTCVWTNYTGLIHNSARYVLMVWSYPLAPIIPTNNPAATFNFSVWDDEKHGTDL